MQNNISNTSQPNIDVAVQHSLEVIHDLNTIFKSEPLGYYFLNFLLNGCGRQLSPHEIPWAVNTTNAALHIFSWHCSIEDRTTLAPFESAGIVFPDEPSHLISLMTDIFGSNGSDSLWRVLDEKEPSFRSQYTSFRHSLGEIHPEVGLILVRDAIKSVDLDSFSHPLRDKLLKLLALVDSFPSALHEAGVERVDWDIWRPVFHITEGTHLVNRLNPEEKVFWRGWRRGFDRKSAVKQGLISEMAFNGLRDISDQKPMSLR